MLGWFLARNQHQELPPNSVWFTCLARILYVYKVIYRSTQLTVLPYKKAVIYQLYKQPLMPDSLLQLLIWNLCIDGSYLWIIVVSVNLLFITYMRENKFVNELLYRSSHACSVVQV